jgi:predicted nucleotidyltransferase component of viral defense system
MTEQTYLAQLRLLLRILPHVAAEDCFALKGGTAINLFVRSLPRLSVDIDLTYIPLEERAASLAHISEALGRIRERLEEAIPGIVIPASPANVADEVKLLCRLGDASVKIEVNTVLRGTAWPVATLGLADAVQDEFGLYAEMAVVSHGDLFGGKLCAALDRQHPRDLFDIAQLYAHEGLTDDIVQGFLVALLSHPRPMHELIRPNLLDQQATFAAQFDGMARLPFTYDDFVRVRERLVMELPMRITDRDRKFLLGFKAGNPDWSLAPSPMVKNLPAVQWKLGNIQKLLANKRKHAAQLKALRDALTVF